MQAGIADRVWTLEEIAKPVVLLSDVSMIRAKIEAHDNSLLRLQRATDNKLRSRP